MFEMESLAATGIREKSEHDVRAIYQDIKKQITDGGLEEGSRLPTERALATQFGAARNTVRKTMNLLVEEGLIERHVGRGTFVAARSAPPADNFMLTELLEARLLFEPNLPDLVVERATPDHIADMERCLDMMRSAKSWVDFKEAKYALHLAIARASCNRFIVSIFEQILASRRLAHWGLKEGRAAPASAVREIAWSENMQIVEALKAGDADAARDAIRLYLLRTLSGANMH